MCAWVFTRVFVLYITLLSCIVIREVSSSYLGPKMALLTDGFVLCFSAQNISAPVPQLRLGLFLYIVSNAFSINHYMKKNLTYRKCCLIHYKWIKNKLLIQKGSSCVNAAVIGPSPPLSSRPSVTCRPDTWTSSVWGTCRLNLSLSEEDALPLLES